MVSFFSCGKSDDNGYPYKVTYKVTSEATNILIGYYDNGAALTEEVQSGWSKEVTIDKGYATITAVAFDESNLKVKAQIIRDGKVIKEGEGINVALTDL